MSNNKGTLVIAPIRPFSSGDTFATAYANEIKGGHHVASGITERNAIPSERRLEGMLCTVLNPSPATTYQLLGGIDNSNWQTFSGGGGLSGITVKDQNNSFEQNDVQILNFIGYNPTSNVRVLPGGGSQVDIWIEAPDFVSHFDSQDGTNDSRVGDLSTTSRDIAGPNSEGNPYKIGGWSAGSSQSSIRESISPSYSPVNEFSIVDYNTTFEAIIYDADGVTELVNYTVPLSGNSSDTDSGVTITITNWATDNIKYSADLTVSFDLDEILPTGGRFSVSLTHYNGADGNFTFTQNNLFRDTETTGATLAGPLTLGEGNTVITKFISGVEYYTLNSQFAFSASGINYLNDRSYPSTEQMNADDTGLGLTAINNIQGNDFDAWTNLYNNSGASYSINTWGITATNYFSKTTNAHIDANIYDWGLVASNSSNTIAVIIDTYVDSSDRNSEMFRSEDFRLQSDLETFWNSGNSLKTEDDGLGLQVIDDRLIYPVEDFGVYDPNSGSQPDYSTGISGDRTYYRRFWTSGPTATNGVIQFSDYNITEAELSANTCFIEISIDSGTSWWNACNEQLVPGKTLVDGDHCRVELDTYALDINNSIKFTMGQNAFSNEIWIRITYKSTLTSGRYIGGLDLTGGTPWS
jgi:hypothetical protein